MTFEEWFLVYETAMRLEGKYNDLMVDGKLTERDRSIAKYAWIAALERSDTMIERKVKARDVHYKLIEQYGLWSTPPDVAEVRKLLEKLAGVE